MMGGGEKEKKENRKKKSRGGISQLCKVSGKESWVLDKMLPFLSCALE